MVKLVFGLATHDLHQLHVRSERNDISSPVECSPSDPLCSRALWPTSCNNSSHRYMCPKSRGEEMQGTTWLELSVALLVYDLGLAGSLAIGRGIRLGMNRADDDSMHAAK